MAFSQKHPGKILVPWYSSHEWEYVYNLIYSQSSDIKLKQEALKIMQVWKSRTPVLSSGLEGTLQILFALTQNYQNDDIKKSVYANAITRFLNLCAANCKQGTLYDTAKKNEIPDWIVDLRHKCSHGYELPSIETFELAMEFALDWLEKKYWKSTFREESPNVSKTNKKNNSVNTQNFSYLTDWVVENNTELDKKVYEHFGVLCSLTQRFISAKVHKNEIIELGKRFGDKYCNNIRQLHLSAVEYLTKYSSHIDGQRLSKIMIEKGHILEDESSISQTMLTKDMLGSWELIVLFLYNEGFISTFLLELYAVVINEFISDNSKVIATLWMYEIFLGLLRQKIKKDKKINKDIDTPSDVKDKIDDSRINFKFYKSSLSSELNLVKECVLTDPCEYSLRFIELLLKLCSCSDSYIKQTVQNIRDATIIENIDAEFDPQEANELLNVLEDTFEKKLVEADQMEVDQSVVESKSIWIKVRDPTRYSGLPLGVMPNQDRTVNPILSFSILN